MPDKKSNELAALSLIQSIKQCHEEFEKTFETSAEWAIRCGEILCQLKEHTGHGGFGGFIEQYLPFSHRRANEYMKLHKDLGHLSNSRRSAILKEACSVHGVQKLLPAPAKKPPSKPKPDPTGPQPDPTDDETGEDDETGTEPQESTSRPPRNGTEKPAASTPPKQYDRSFWFKQYMNQVGPLARLVDKIANEIGEPKSKWRNETQKLLQQATDAIQKGLKVEL